jgi:hypothetical protein
MNENPLSRRLWLTALVAAHLVVSIVHGTAHNQAHVPLSPVATLFVFLVIVAGPVVGLALTWRAERLGAWVIALTLSGSFMFGFLKHFVLMSPDHVANVAGPWQSLFTTTALLLAVTEAAGAALAVQFVHKMETMS